MSLSVQFYYERYRFFQTSEFSRADLEISILARLIPTRSWNRSARDSGLFILLVDLLLVLGTLLNVAELVAMPLPKLNVPRCYSDITIYRKAVNYGHSWSRENFF